MEKKGNNPESHMMTYGYKPELSEGAVKCPIFQTSTFVFNTAEEGKAFFEIAYGIREKAPSEELGLIYSRINNPNLEILENRLSLWDKADDCAVFESGMSAISTVLLEFLKPGDLLVYSNPTYGGTDHFINHFLPKIGVHTLGIFPDQTIDEVIHEIEATGLSSKLSMIYLETPANPNNALFDIKEMSSYLRAYFERANESEVILAVDNTYMGPIWQKPLELGADLSIYSATKYIGGHSDLIAGAVMGKLDLMVRVKTLRTFLGNMISPHTAWLLLRSLETLKLRMDKQCENAQKVAQYLCDHPMVERVYYLGLLSPSDEGYFIYKNQCTGPGAMISFDIKGSEKEAFDFLNQLNLIKLAVSLGSTESLAQHPMTMTHAGVDPEQRTKMNITEKMIRLSIGVEHHNDIIKDLDQAFSLAQNPVEISEAILKI